MLKIAEILLQSRKNHLILVGELGVGKTEIVAGFLQLLTEGGLPEALSRPAVIEISLTSLVGRTGRFRGLGFGVSPSRDECGGHRRATGEQTIRKLSWGIDSGGKRDVLAPFLG
jgi:hypothetical protein